MSRLSRSIACKTVAAISLFAYSSAFIERCDFTLMEMVFDVQTFRIIVSRIRRKSPAKRDHIYPATG